MADTTNHSLEAAEEATSATLGANPFLRLDPTEMLSSAVRLVGRATFEPAVHDDVRARTAELVRVVTGQSDIAPSPKDRRFADGAWKTNPVYRRLMQTYLLGGEFIRELPNKVELDQSDADRATLVANMVADSLAPTNLLAGNPAAIKRAIDTGGASLVAGARNLVDDLRSNNGLPSQVDSSPFRLGENLAATEGSVVYRSELLELIQYRPRVEKVFSRPLVMVPPQVNKFYVLDLAENRSMISHALESGQQVFIISWRNPGPEHAEWDLEFYVLEAIKALRAAAEITGSKQVNLLGACAGGITSTAIMSYLAGIGDDLVNAATLLVTVLDSDVPTTSSALATDRAVDLAVRRVRRKGITKGEELARTFAWLRPNDLIWNYWVNNYLMGRQPPAFDVLAWNADATNLPAGLQIDFIRLLQANAMVNGGIWTIDGVPLDPKSVKADLYAVGAATDHITPWLACYRTPLLFGGDSQFVLSSSGHIQALVNPPGNPKSRFHTNSELPGSAEDWLAGAEEHQGTWWDHWLEWLGSRSGRRKAAPTKLGSKTHKPLDDAPGRYVRS